jgi:iron complex outermembrane receptor protein
MKNRQHHMQDQKKSNKTLQLASLALAVASANWMPAAVAQDAGQGQSFGFLEEIVVTARRREESAQDIPVAVTAMNSDMLRSQNITELNDLGAQVPSSSVYSWSASVRRIHDSRPSGTHLFR